MSSVRAVLVAFLFGAALSTLPIVLQSRSEIATMLDVHPPPFFNTVLGLTSCCVSFALYPSVGAAFAYLRPRASRTLLSVGVGGATASIAVLVWQLLFVAITSATDPIAEFQQGLSAAASIYGRNTTLLHVMVGIGFLIAVSFVSLAGAAGAVLLRALLADEGAVTPGRPP